MAKRYKMPAVGTMLPGKENDLAAPSATDQDAVLLFEQREAQGEALRRTDLAVDGFDDRIENWLEYVYETGRAIGPGGKVGDPKAQPPFGPPLAYWAVLMQGDAGVWWDVRQVGVGQGGKLACKMPKWDKITAPQH